MSTRYKIAGLGASAALLVALIKSISCRFSFAPHWGKDGIINTPAQYAEAIEYYFAGYSFALFPLSHRGSLPVALKKYAGNFVTGLFLGSCPPAILRAVWSVVVDTIYGVLLAWGFPHILKKQVEILPSFTNIDSSTGISGEIIPCLFRASSNHQPPSVVLLCTSSTVRITRLTVNQVYGRRYVHLKAPARPCVSNSQLARRNVNDVTAVALTRPFSRGFTGSACSYGYLQYCEATEAHSSAVNKLWHFFTLKYVTVLNAWRLAVNKFSGATLAKPCNFNRVAV